MRHFSLIVLALSLGYSLFSQKTPSLNGQQSTANSQQPFDSTLIDVTIEGLPAGKVRLVGTLGEQNYLADSTVADANGHFVIRRKSALPAGFYYFLLPGSANFSILFDQDQRFTLRAKVNDIPNTMEVDGSLNTKLLYENFRFQNQQDPELRQLGETMRKNTPTSAEYKQARARHEQLMAERKANLDEVGKKYPDAFFVRFKIAGQNPDLKDYRKPNGDLDTLRQLLDYRKHFWDGVDFNDARLLHTPVVVNKLRRYITELTPQRPDSIIKVSDELIRRVIPNKEYFKFFANWIALQYENGKTKVMDGEAVYVYIIQHFFTNDLAYWSNPTEVEGLQKHVWEMEASLLGKKGPDVRAKNQYGYEKSIYEMTAPLIVVFMYSPDCEHCQKESPEVEALYKKWKDKGVDFYGIAVSTNESDWKQFIEKNGFTFTNVYDPTNKAIYAKYYVDITPELYVLNKDRVIIAKNLHPNQLEEVFEREMKKMQK